VTIRKAIYDASNWEDLHFPVKLGNGRETGYEQIGLLALVAPRLIVRGLGGE